tara:strand:+ start:7619 stop:10117 length:2499 start_codon:yes stop_codon:yes gene_type:complete
MSRMRCLLVVVLVGFACGACRTLGPPVATPAADEASRALAEARTFERSGDLDAARTAARTAADLDPTWIAPLRFLADLDHLALLGPATLDSWRDVLQQSPEDPIALYLAGRLEGNAGTGRFVAATRADANCSWAWHGLAWRKHQKRRSGQAIDLGRRAVALARDSWERTFFTYALATYLDAEGREPQAVTLLAERLASPDLLEADRDWLAVHLARFETGSGSDDLRRRGQVRLAELISRGRLTQNELRSVGRVARLDRAKRRVALAERSLQAEFGSPVLDALEAQTLLGGNTTPLALALAKRAGAAGGLQGPRDGNARLGLELGVRPPHEVVAEWLQDLPGQVLDEAGLPRDAGLAELVRTARATSNGGAAATVDFGEALLLVGWFDAARSYASALPYGDLDQALHLDRRAAAGQLMMREISRLVSRVDRGAARFDPELDVPVSEALDGGAEVKDLDDLLTAVAAVLTQGQAVLGNPGLGAALANTESIESPLIRYGIAGAVVHPGPFYSALDQRLGLGSDGDVVPGLAQAARALGRFPLFGDAWGTPPDAALMRQVWVEERSGQHLGLPWSGTVAICDGVDVEGRDGRRGARIAGAALHEGYWLELSALRAELDEWELLRSAFQGPDAAARIQAALDVRGLRAKTREERRSIDLPLDEGQRMRLAVMLERGPGDGTLGSITLDDLVTVTGVHEEAHLCDRARFYPLGEHWGAVFRLLWDAGFSPLRVMQRLEYRAQLVAFCASPDPRIALVELLDAAQNGTNLTPHAAAYTRLLEHLVERLDIEIAGGAYPPGTFDPERTLVHQLHRIDPEMLRSLGLRQAADEGLVGPNS